MNYINSGLGWNSQLSAMSVRTTRGEMSVSKWGKINSLCTLLVLGSGVIYSYDSPVVGAYKSSTRPQKSLQDALDWMVNYVNRILAIRKNWVSFSDRIPSWWDIIYQNWWIFVVIIVAQTTKCSHTHQFSHGNFIGWVRDVFNVKFLSVSLKFTKWEFSTEITT